MKGSSNCNHVDRRCEVHDLLMGDGKCSCSQNDTLVKQRACTCHCDDKPPVCQHKYALRECLAAYTSDASAEPK